MGFGIGGWTEFRSKISLPLTGVGLKRIKLLKTVAY